LPTHFSVSCFNREETASGSTQKQIETEGTMEQQPTNQAAKDVDATQ